MIYRESKCTPSHRNELSSQRSSALGIAICQTESFSFSSKKINLYNFRNSYREKLCIVDTQKIKETYNLDGIPTGIKACAAISIHCRHISF